MTKSTRLSDLQLILLSNASQREHGNILPAPDTVAGDTDRIAKQIPPLLKRQLIEEAPVTDMSRAWREQDQQPMGLFITDAGRTLIVVNESGDAESSPEAGADAPSSQARAAPRVGSKTELVLGLLRRPEGATLAELVAATGWLPHTTRAALTGLRKKGHAIIRDKRDEATCYRIAEAG
jgi:hypothetical protein